MEEIILSNTVFKLYSCKREWLKYITLTRNLSASHFLFMFQKLNSNNKMGAVGYSSCSQKNLYWRLGLELVSPHKMNYDCVILVWNIFCGTILGSLRLVRFYRRTKLWSRANKPKPTRSQQVTRIFCWLTLWISEINFSTFTEIVQSSENDKSLRYTTQVDEIFMNLVYSTEQDRTYYNDSITCFSKRRF